MTEQQIESRVSRMMDHLDRCYLVGDMTRKNYELAVKDLDQWAKAKRADHIPC